MSLTKKLYLNIMNQEEEFTDYEEQNYWESKMIKKREFAEKVLDRFKSILEDEHLILMYDFFDDMIIKEDGTVTLPVGNFSLVKEKVLDSMNL